MVQHFWYVELFLALFFKTCQSWLTDVTDAKYRSVNMLVFKQVYMITAIWLRGLCIFHCLIKRGNSKKWACHFITVLYNYFTKSHLKKAFSIKDTVILHNGSVAGFSMGEKNIWFWISDLKTSIV